MTEDRASFRSERHVNTYADLYRAAYHFLKLAQTPAAGRNYLLVSTLTFSAFSFEAYLNHIGPDIFPSWRNLERLRVLDKLEIICRQVKVAPDLSRRPFQTVHNLFRFRNSVAHGRSQVLKVEKDIHILDDPWRHVPKADWEEYATLANAKMAYEDVRGAINAISVAGGYGEELMLRGTTLVHKSLPT